VSALVGSPGVRLITLSESLNNYPGKIFSVLTFKLIELITAEG
jgi:hypothetical protein